MAYDALAALLAPYRSALAGDEMNEMDPIYALLNPGLGFREKDDGTAPGPVRGGRSLRALADQYGWDEGRKWDDLLELMNRESGGDRFADNPTSTAHGRWQFLDSTWAGVGGHKTNNRYLQDLYGLRYIAQRYGGPSRALSFHNRNNYY